MLTQMFMKILNIWKGVSCICLNLCNKMKKFGFTNLVIQTQVFVLCFNQAKAAQLEKNQFF